MQNSIIKILIVAITTAILSLIGMQYYWVHSSVELRREDFNRNVKDALQAVSEYLENFETISLIQAQEQNRYLFIDDDAEDKIFSAGGDTAYEYMLLERYVQQGNSLEVQITEEKDGEEVSETTEILEVETPKFGMNSDSSAQVAGSNFPYQSVSLSRELRKRKALKNAYIGEIEKKLTKIIFSLTLEERIDSLLLDSILQLALYEQGIETPFEFGVYDAKGMFRFGSANQATKHLQDSPHKTRLFKHDYVGKPGHLKVYFPKEKGFILKSSGYMLLTSVLVVFAIIYIFYWSVKAIITQKKNSEIKNDFINNMTHELKTPISTISLAVEVLHDPSMAKNEGLVSRYLKMIHEENKRLGMLVEEVLQSAVLDRGAFKLKQDPIQMDQLVTEVVGKMDMKLNDKKGDVEINIDPSGEYDFVGDKVHLTNVLYNLIDNAIKYSKDEPHIKIDIENAVNYLAIRVTDNGIGISKDHVKKVFDKLYRVPTGNLHDVKGFGLGLNYVKTIVNRHGGSVDVTSVLGKGSTFSIYLPRTKKNEN